MAFRACGEASVIGASPGLQLNNQEAYMPSMKENAVRARARVRGYSIHKSQDRSMHIDNHGEYMLVLNDMNCVVLGQRFDASLDDIAEYLAS
jgi:hypothetical protein